jgi:hypothetical protein
MRLQFPRDKNPRAFVAGDASTQAQRQQTAEGVGDGDATTTGGARAAPCRCSGGSVLAREAPRYLRRASCRRRAGRITGVVAAG